MNARDPQTAPTPWRHLPNAITLARVALVAPLVGSIARHEYNVALVLVAVAGASDALDGLLAKRYGWQSWLGGVLDPLADKLLLLACFISLNWAAVMPSWMMWLAIGRDLVIVAGALAYHYLVGRVVPQPSLTSKLTTCLQIALVIVLLLDHGSWFALPVALVDGLLWITAAVTLGSGLQYVFVWSRKALAARSAEVNV